MKKRILAIVMIACMAFVYGCGNGDTSGNMATQQPADDNGGDNTNSATGDDTTGTMDDAGNTDGADNAGITGSDNGTGNTDGAGNAGDAGATNGIGEGINDAVNGVEDAARDITNGAGNAIKDVTGTNR